MLRLLCRLLTSAPRSGGLSTASVAVGATRGRSPGVSSIAFGATTAGSTLRALDGYGLRDSLPARPALAPRIRFLFIGSHLCSTLPSDLTSRRQPLRFTNPSPPSGWVEDFHLQAIEHARHTTNPLPREWGERVGEGLLSERIVVVEAQSSAQEPPMAELR